MYPVSIDISFVCVQMCSGNRLIKQEKVMRAGLSALEAKPGPSTLRFSRRTQSYLNHPLSTTLSRARNVRSPSIRSVRTFRPFQSSESPFPLSPPPRLIITAQRCCQHAVASANPVTRQPRCPQRPTATHSGAGADLSGSGLPGARPPSSGRAEPVTSQGRLPCVFPPSSGRAGHTGTRAGSFFFFWGGGLSRRRPLSLPPGTSPSPAVSRFSPRAPPSPSGPATGG